MNHQREKPGAPTVEELKVMLKLPPTTNGYASGGQYENFRESWALDIWSGAGKRGHYFQRNKDNIAFVTSLCNLTVPAKNMYGIGSYPKCQHCLRYLRKMRGVALKCC